MLLNNRYAPITNSIGFLKAKYEDVNEAYYKWKVGLGQFGSRTEITGGLPAAFDYLCPLTGPQIKDVIIETRSEWAATFGNFINGGDCTWVKYISSVLRCHEVNINCVPFTKKRNSDKGTYGANQFHYEFPGGHEGVLLADGSIFAGRVVSLVNDAGRMDFHIFGKELPFEEIERYKAKRLRDRFTAEMLVRYCQAMGIDPYNDEFYGDLSFGYEEKFAQTRQVRTLTLNEKRKAIGLE